MELRTMTREEMPAWHENELREAFPPNECKPLSDFFALMDAGRYELLGLYEGGALLGYAGMWQAPEHPDYILLDVLGVTAQRRNGGLGSAILSLLAKRYPGKCIIVEAEYPVPEDSPEENSLRIRRIGFYERAGFVKTYEMGTCGIRCQTLVLGPAEENALMDAHRKIYGEARTDVKIPAKPGEVLAPPRWMKQ